MFLYRELLLWFGPSTHYLRPWTLWVLASSLRAYVRDKYSTLVVCLERDVPARLASRSRCRNPITLLGAEYQAAKKLKSYLDWALKPVNHTYLEPEVQTLLLHGLTSLNTGTRET